MKESYNWGVPVQGRRLPMADLIRFPSESLRYDKFKHSKLTSNTPCPKGSKLLYDFEAFQVDRYGSLMFTRTLGYQKINHFCLDSVSLGSPHQFMAAVFCKPDNVSETVLDNSLQKLILPNSADVSGKMPVSYFIVLFVQVVLPFVVH